MLTTEEIWSRDWELLYRCVEIFWARIGDHPAVLRSRREFGKFIDWDPIPCSPYEANRFSNLLDPIIEIAAERWVALFNEWYKKRRAFVFPDGYSVLFFVRVLWANDVVLFRGHYDSAWRLCSTWSRAETLGKAHLRAERKCGEDFLRRLWSLKSIRNCYSPEIPFVHKEAILQHYGFPTLLMDFTYSADVGLFFAEGGQSWNPESKYRPETGAIYAIPTFMLPRSSQLVTLPPNVVRASLQRGLFIADIEEEELERLEALRFVFLHQHIPIWSGIGNLNFGGPISIANYLFPASDEIASIVKQIREEEEDSTN